MTNRPNQRPKTTIQPKTILGILAIILIPVSLWMFVNPGGAGEYQFYAGPVLPLSSLSGAEHMEAERMVTLDFTNCKRPSVSTHDPNTVIVTDSYALTNTSDRPVTLELVWGFEGQFTDVPEHIPNITVDGAPANATMYPSTDLDEQVQLAYSFEKYREVLTEHDFLSIAMAETPRWDVPVKVYHFYDLAYVGGENYDMPLLDVTYTMGDQTNLWTRVFKISGYDRDTDRYRLAFQVSAGEAWLYVIGEDIQDLQIAGNQGYNISDDTAIDGVTYQLETYESTLMDCLWEYAQEYQYVPGPGGNPALDLTTPEMFYDGAMKRIVDTKYQEPSTYVRVMRDLFEDVITDIRMLYWVFPVEIPAGETVHVTGQYEQEISSNYLSERSLEGFDLATTLGSNLNFTKQTAAVVNTDTIAIADGGESQNFGFDLEDGITAVELDLTTQRYYLDYFVKD